MAGSGAFAALLREHRTNAGLTQEELAEAAQLSVRTISDLERGIYPTARKETARLLADALRLTGDAKAEFEAIARGRQPARQAGEQTGTSGVGGTAGATRTLPRDIASFTGRAAELADLVAAATAGGVVGIHAIGGMAGVGKTAFAVHAAHRLADQFPDGQFFLPLHGHTPGRRPVDPSDALASLLLTAGVAAAAIPADPEARAGLWRDRLAGKRALLVLDDATGSDQVRPLLPGDARSLVLITSRRHLLALEDARAVSLDTLPAADAADLLVRLAARPGLGAAQDAGVREIARLCGYLPLAIGMLASQLRHHPSWSIGDVTEDLAAARNRLAVMAVENLSVAAAFDLSYADLTGAQQRMFRYLGLHPGTDIDAYAAAALADEDLVSARQTLAALYDHYLLTEPARGRYRMHDLVREHARKAASEDELADKDTARTRLLDYYLHTARDAGQRLEPSTGPAMPEPPGVPPAYAPTFADRVSAVAWLAAERLNLHAAAEDAAGAGHGGYVVGIAAAMQPHLRSHGHWGQAIALHEAALRFAVEAEDEFCQAYTLKNLGAMQRMTDDYAGANASLELALRLFTGLGDLLGQADTLMNIGAVQRSLGDPASAITSLRPALELYRTARNERGESAALNHLGQAQLTAGDHPAAIPTFARAIELARRVGDQTGEANALSSLANAQRRMGEHQAAISSARQAIALARALGDRYQALAALNTIGLAQLEVGEDLASVDSFSEVLREAEELGVRRAVAAALNNLSQAHLTLGNFQLATACAERALAVHREIGDRRGEALALGMLAVVQREVGDPETRASMEQVLRIFRDIGDRLSEAETLNNLAELPGPTAGQRSLAAEALAIARDIASPSQEARALELIGLSHLSAGDTAEASQFLRQSLETYQRIETPAPERVRQALRDLGS